MDAHVDLRVFLEAADGIQEPRAGNNHLDRPGDPFLAGPDAGLVHAERDAHVVRADEEPDLFALLEEQHEQEQEEFHVSITRPTSGDNADSQRPSGKSRA